MTSLTSHFAPNSSSKGFQATSANSQISTDILISQLRRARSSCQTTKLKNSHLLLEVSSLHEELQEKNCQINQQTILIEELRDMIEMLKDRIEWRDEKIADLQSRLENPGEKVEKMSVIERETDLLRKLVEEKEVNNRLEKEIFQRDKEIGKLKREKDLLHDKVEEITSPKSQAEFTPFTNDLLYRNRSMHDLPTDIDLIDKELAYFTPRIKPDLQYPPRSKTDISRSLSSQPTHPLSQFQSPNISMPTPHLSNTQTQPTPSSLPIKTPKTPNPPTPLPPKFLPPNTPRHPTLDYFTKKPEETDGKRNRRKDDHWDGIKRNLAGRAGIWG